MKRTVDQLRAGVCLSYVNLLLGSMLPMLYTPLMLSMLGEAEHGLYSLACSVSGYLSLLSFGFGSTIVRYLSGYRAEHRTQAVRQVFGFFLVLYTALGVLALLCGWTLAESADAFFGQSVSMQELEKMQHLLRIMALHTALSFPTSVISEVLTAYERYVFRRSMDIVATVAGPAVNLAALCMGYASVGLAAASTLLQAVILAANAVYCVRTLGITPTYRRLPGALVREMIGFSAYVLIGSVADMLFWSTDKVILGMRAGTAAVSVYQIGSAFNAMLIQLSTAISGVLTPRITGMVVKNASSRELSALFIRVGRLQLLVVALAVTGFAVFGQSFLLLWAGESYVESYWIAVLTLFPLCIPLIQNTGISILTAKGRHGFRSLMYLGIAVINVISTWLVVPTLGGVGAALCSCLSYLFGQGLLMNVYYHRVIGLDIPTFWRTMLKNAALPGALMVVGLLLRRYMSFDSWASLLAGICVYTLVYALGMYTLVMGEHEKELFRSPVQRLVHTPGQKRFGRQKQ